MWNVNIVAALAGFGLGALLPAQEPEVPAPTTEEHPQDQALQSAADHVRALGSDSFRERSKAERALRALGEAALPALRDAADRDDPETQWRARRLIRQIEGRSTGGLTRRGPGDTGSGDPDRDGVGRGGLLPPRRGGWRVLGPGNEDIQERFDQLFSQLENDFGMDIPRHRFFADGFFQDLQEQMDAMHQQMRGMQQGMQQGNSTSIQIGPNGVRVEVKSKDEDGKEDSKVYEAPDLESFKAQYPGVLEQNGLGMGFGPGILRLGRGGDAFGFQWPQGGLQSRGWNRRPGGGFQWSDPDPDAGADADADAEPHAADDFGALQPRGVDVVPPADRRLGVLVAPEVPAAVRDYLGIDGGLLVEEVQPKTLAADLGIAAGDIVVHIGDVAIGTTADVQEALGAIDAGKIVEVKVIRRGRELVLEAKKPAAEKPEAKPLEKRDGGR